MRLRLSAPLGPHLQTPFDDHARRIRPEDAPRLAALMFAAYRGTVDDAGVDLGAAQAEVNRLLGGAYGPFDWTTSELIERDGEAVAATLVTRFENVPMVAFSMTLPAWKRRGLARAGLSRVMARLAAAGNVRVDLAVTVGNTPAQALYASLGFVPV